MVIASQTIRINDLHVHTHTPIYIFIAATDRFIRRHLFSSSRRRVSPLKTDALQSAISTLDVFASCSALKTLERVVKLSIDVLSASKCFASCFFSAFSLLVYVMLFLFEAASTL